MSKNSGNSKLAQTPPMGWNSWNVYSCAVTEEDIRDAADALVETGLRDVGYEYLVIDDCWMADETDSRGRLRPHPEDFPSGIDDLADYVHDRGLKFGIYSSAGTRTCQGYPASLGRERLHAQQFAEWGIDYLKYDNCGDHDGRDAITRYAAMGDALRETDRDIVYSICEWGLNDPWTWGRNVGGHLWRTTGDIVAKWRAEDDEFGDGLVQIIDRAAEQGSAEYQAPDGWNDPDMLQVGNGPDSGQSQHEAVTVERPFTKAEERTHFSFWCMFSAPLMAGTDLRNLSETTHEVLTNEQAIAINQDPLGIQATRDRVYGSREVWSKRLVDDEAAVVLFNQGEEADEVRTHVDEVNVPVTADRYRVRDLWTDEEWETDGELSDTVDPHGVTLVRVSPAE
ncbi:glycoside hydrolase family 27 protein [Haladaptatus pallidirubidus]|uniref:Alpha galactosidase C-terminal domain-containing protein n=1 Tax=Haladaptatus pallidirubidus TaxID=1008152 RepID=A0AAV3UPG5_9EURY|nr:glycoside hydrolase family 27 protein [Haladaptatus pallidirubidus]